MTENDILTLVQNRQWLLLAGLLIMALVTFGRTFVARAGWTGKADKAVSVVGAYLQDISVMLPLFGYNLWPWAFLGAFRGVLMSGGLAELLAMVVVAKKPPTPPETPRTTQKTPRETPLPTPTASSGASSTLRMAIAAGAVAVLLGTGCGAENRCLAERTTVAALGVALGMAEGLVPDTPEADEAVSIASASLDAGSALVAICEQLRDDSDNWREWLTVAVRVVKAVLAIIAAAGVNLDASVLEQVERIERLVAANDPAQEPRTAPYSPEEW